MPQVTFHRVRMGQNPLQRPLERLTHKGVWAIFLNLFLPDSRGLHTIDKFLSVTSTAPIFVLGGVDDEDICKAACYTERRTTS